ncbi:MAG: hypothetical protein RL072_1825 [Actinomycetota bacterium]|jgi:hypothetical protein
MQFAAASRYRDEDDLLAVALMASAAKHLLVLLLAHSLATTLDE